MTPPNNPPSSHLVQRALAMIMPREAAPAPAGRQRVKESKEPGDEPWPDPVDGGHLLNTIVRAILCYVAMPREAAHATALWVVHSYAADAVDFTPYLLITSPVRMCGKTTLLDVLEPLAYRSRRSDGMSAAALIRTIDRHAPTVLLDELDTRLHSESGELLRGVLNSGFKSTGRWTICVGDSHEPKDFRTYCPKVLAGIGKPWDTVASRSIPVRLARATRREGEKLRKVIGAAIADEFAPIRQQCVRWTRDHHDDLARSTHPMVPGTLNAREGDIWRPLIAIADRAGGRWVQRSRAAAVAIHGVVEDEQDLATGVLSDVRRLFTDAGVDRIKTSTMVEQLVAQEDRPWQEMPGSGRPLTAAGLARLLKRFDVRPKNLRDEGTVLKGYFLCDLQPAFGRYLPATPGFAATAATAATLSTFRAVAGVAAVAATSGGDGEAEFEIDLGPA